jgi:hypothetical protein
MATRKFRPRIVKAEVAGLAAVVGVTEAERRTGIAKNTIQRWVHDPEFVHLRTTARALVLEQWWAGIQMGASSMMDDMLGPAPLRDKATAWSSLVDRYALLSGEATSRTESKALTDDLDDTEKQRLRDWIDGLAAATSPESAPV